MLDKIKKFFGGAIGICTAIFITIYLVSWVSNSLFGTKFVMRELVDLWQLMIPKIAEYFAKSIFNTPREVDPHDKKEGVQVDR